MRQKQGHVGVLFQIKLCLAEHDVEAASSCLSVLLLLVFITPGLKYQTQPIKLSLYS